MKEEENLIYYSVNSYLAHYINTYFYNEEHYVWCSPVFNPETLDQYHIWKKIPPSSSPYHIFECFCQDVDSDDRHSSKISENRAGLIRGAGEKLSAGIIDLEDFARINKIIDEAGAREFRPLIFLIPADKVKSKIKLVDVRKVASPLSVEYLISDLKKSEFEIIEPRKLK